MFWRHFGLFPGTPGWMQAIQTCCTVHAQIYCWPFSYPPAMVLEQKDPNCFAILWIDIWLFPGTENAHIFNMFALATLFLTTPYNSIDFHIIHANYKSTFPFYLKVFFKVDVHFSHTGCTFPHVFFVHSSVYCHIMLIWWYSGSHGGLKKEFSCAVSSCLFRGCAEWFILQRVRKLQQCQVSLSCPAAMLDCSKSAEPRCQGKGMETRAGPSGEVGTFLLTFVWEGLHRLSSFRAHGQRSCVSCKKWNSGTMENY